MEERELLKDYSLSLCGQMICELNRNIEDSRAFLGGEMLKAYVKATEEAINKANRIKMKIRNL